MDINPHPQLEKTVLINQLLSELYNLVETLEAQHIRPDHSKPEMLSQPGVLESTASRSRTI
jgi:hypothetical protein